MFEETAEPTYHNDTTKSCIPANTANQKKAFLETFNQKRHYSSWCKFELQNQKDNRKEYGYGQINYCLNIASLAGKLVSYEPMLEGEIMVSICGRYLKHHVDKRKRDGDDGKYPPYDRSNIPTINLDTMEDLTYDDTKIFIHAKDICASPVSIIGVNGKSIPFTKNESEVKVTDIVKILLIDLH